MRFKGILNSLPRDISFPLQKVHKAQEKIILFIIVDMTCDMKAFQAHLLNRNILTLKKW